MFSANNLDLLLKKIAHDDCEKSFKIVFEHFYSKLFDIALYYLKSSILAEEAVSDVFVKIWNNRKRLDQIKNLRSYLFISVKRQSFNYLKRQRKNLLYIEDLDFEIMIKGNYADQDLLSVEIIEAYKKAIKSLPEKCRIVYLLAKEDNMKYKDISDLLNISVKTVEAQMNIAHKKLRLFLKNFRDDNDHSQRANIINSK